MYLQIRIFNIQRHSETFTLNGTGERCRNVEIQRVTEFIMTRGAAGFDAGSHVAGVVTSKTGFAQRAEQVTQGFETEKVEALVSDLEFRLLLGLTDLAAHAGAFGWIMRLVNADVILLLHALDQLLDQVFQRTVHLHLLKLLARLFVKQLTVHE